MAAIAHVLEFYRRNGVRAMRVTSGHVVVVGKLVFSGGLVWYVSAKFQIWEALTQLEHLTPAWAALILATYLAQLGFSAQRYQQFLQVYGYQYRLLSCLSANWVAAFFSQTFISFVGGDAMRIMRIHGEGVPLAASAKAVVLDRASGFASQLVLIVAVLPFALPRLPDPTTRFGLLALVLCGVGGALAALVAAKLPSSLREIRGVEAVSDVAARVLRRISTPRGFIAFFGYSLLINISNIFLFYFIGRGLQVDLSFLDCAVLLPPVFLISMLPISVSGWGVREGAAILALGAAGIAPSEALAISVCYGVGSMLISLPGGLVWLAGKRPPSVGSNAGSASNAPAGQKARG